MKAKIKSRKHSETSPNAHWFAALSKVPFIGDKAPCSGVEMYILTCR